MSIDERRRLHDQQILNIGGGLVGGHTTSLCVIVHTCNHFLKFHTEC